jgi:hypothetical protein
MVPWLVLIVVIAAGEWTRYRRHRRLTTKDTQ